MCKFRPFNKHILVKKKEKVLEENTSGVLIPDGVSLKDKERYGLVKFVCAAPDCENFLLNLNGDKQTWATQTGTMDDVFIASSRTNGNASLIVDKTMIEEITIERKKYHIVHQNYVVGAIDE